MTYWLHEYTTFCEWTKFKKRMNLLKLYELYVKYLFAYTDKILELSNWRIFQKCLRSALYLKRIINSYPFHKDDQIGCFKISMLNLFTFEKYLIVFAHFFTYSVTWNIFFETSFPSWFFSFLILHLFHYSNRRQKRASL